MLKRLVAAALMASALMVALPGAAQAGHGDAHEECKNDEYPVIYQLVEGNRIVRVNVRVLCVQEPPPPGQVPADECENEGDPLLGLRINGQPVTVLGIRLVCRKL